MKVLCIDRNCIGAALTVGKGYDVTKETEIYYYMVDDTGKVTGFYKDHFEPINTYSLTLSEDEINTIYVLVGNVTGSGSNSPRMHCDTLYDKIKSILNTKIYNLVENKLMDCTVNFEDYPITKTPQQLKIEELENTINEAQKQLQELKGL